MQTQHRYTDLNQAEDVFAPDSSPLPDPAIPSINFTGNREEEP